jgi:hypothetical protein
MMRRLARWPIVIAGGVALAAVTASVAGAQESDDWKVIERKSNYGDPDGETAAETQHADDGIVNACGMKARPAQPQYAGMIAEINGLWGVDFPLYESTSVKSVFARKGGCVFYSPEFFDALMGTWMNVRDPAARTPLLYAVLAHEVGHQYHGDFDWRRDRVSVKTKELGADQFAGYTLARLRMRLDPDEVTKYYQMVGDDFIGTSSDHGTGKERTAAFMDGWRRGRAGVPEESARPAGGLGSDYLPE